ncbi:Vacuolar protease A [Fusarium solani]
MVDLHSLPEGSRPNAAIRNNGPDHLVLERQKLRELAEGWPVYRDSCEWGKLRVHLSSWSPRLHYLAGMDKGAFIMHRCHGSSTDINVEGTRAVTKLKATITQRFEVDGAEFDVEADCRFCFYFEKINGSWGARLVRHCSTALPGIIAISGFRSIPIADHITSTDATLPAHTSNFSTPASELNTRLRSSGRGSDRLSAALKAYPPSVHTIGFIADPVWTE